MDIVELGNNEYMAPTRDGAEAFAASIRAGIRTDWDVEVAHAPADSEAVGLVGTYHRPERIVVRASGDFARGAWPVRDQGRAKFSAVIWIGEKPIFERS